jgi:hypothetical protein
VCRPDEGAAANMPVNKVKSFFSHAQMVSSSFNELGIVEIIALDKSDRTEVCTESDS